ncbi:unnamed protein product [Caenorhabditis auriculariae]|uniref:Receptor L-domain domain-containing protein n=1 Tax=Caenorhabditis auriculariae TaxID=2777116 RepID=A0A8S1H9T2_9PELO|nr:unnamed protein product [Caenorhabditis auriculariae]
MGISLRNRNISRKQILFLIAFLIHGSSAQDKCCTLPNLSYSTGNASPHECSHLNCTEAFIYVEDSYGPSNLLFNAVKISTLTLIRNKGKADMIQLEEIVHKSPGPAVTLKQADLEDDCFENLKKITVDDPYFYCDGKNKLIDIEGDYNKTMIGRLEKVANETLAVCNQPRPVTLAAVSSTVKSPVVQSATVISPVVITLNPPPPICPERKLPAVEKASNNDLLLYIYCLSTEILFIIATCLTILTFKLYKKLCAQESRRLLSEALSKFQDTEEADQKNETAVTSAPEVQMERKIAGAESSKLNKERNAEEI